MEGFDTTTMTYMASNFDATEAHPPDVYTNLMMNDFMEQYSNYDAQTFQGYIISANCFSSQEAC